MPYTDQDIGPLLQGMGYQYISGWGPSAQWGVFSQDAKGNYLDAKGNITTDPSKRVVAQQVSQQYLAGNVLKTESPYYTPTPTASAYSGAGLPAGYVQSPTGVVMKQSNGTLIPATQAEIDAINAQAAAPHTSSSYNVSQSYQDPAAIALQQQQLTFQIQDAQAKLQQAQQAQDWQQAYQQQQLIQQATLQREQLTQQATLATQGQQAQAALQQSAQGFQSGQTDKTLAASTANSAADRAERAAEFAASQDAQYRAQVLQADTANAQGEAQAGRDRLAAANQYASLVSGTDTAALPAYLAAGGGVLWNAKANPNAPSLLTDNAINPAAASLQQARTINWQPISVQPPQGFSYGQAAQTTGAATPQSIPGNQPSGFNANNPNTTWMGAVPAGMAGASAQGGAAPAPVNTGSSGPNGPAGGNLSVNAQGQAVGFAGGTGNGFIAAPHQGFLTSEQGAEYMRVVDPPGPNNARIMVMPHPQTMGMLRGFAMGTMPGYADGTADPNAVVAQAGGDPSSDPSSPDPYAAEVRQFRSTFNAPQYGFSQFDPRFSRQLSPGMQQSYFMGQQTQSGVPAEALQSQAAFYTPVGYHSQPYHVTPDLAY